MKTAYYRCKGIDGSSATIEGDKDSLAASLDYALSKQPAWLNDMFGIGAAGDARLRDLIARTNSGRIRPGPVTLSLNSANIGPECIEIFLDGLPVKNGRAFNAILSGLQLGAVTKPLDENADGQSEAHRPPFRSTVIQPASVADIHDIHAYERVEFPGCHATLERLLERRNHD